jgi:hypothetical protein
MLCGMTTTRMTTQTAGALEALGAILNQIKELEQIRDDLTWQVLDSCERGTIKAVADLYGHSPQAVSQWVKRGRHNKTAKAA